MFTRMSTHLPAWILCIAVIQLTYVAISGISIALTIHSLDPRWGYVS